jgi:energy-coupling factor transporter ATP-binding protein EcfA2
MTVELVAKSRSQNGKSWCVLFEHPFRKDPGAQTGQPVRAGLQTNEEEEAEKLRKQLQDLTGDESFWTPKAKTKAKTLFDERVVAAVYGQWQEPSFENIRDSCLPFQGEEGYADIQLVGERGSGKTTLLRKLLGLAEEAEPFPAAGCADGAAYETEWLFADQECYEAVVTFVPFLTMRTYVEEAVLQAAEAYVMESSEFGMVEALAGKEGKLRSLIGPLPAAISRMYGWRPSADEHVEVKRWAPYVKAIQAEALRLRNELISSGQEPNRGRVFQDAWKRDVRCRKIGEFLLGEAERNFSLLEEGSITYHEDDWPLYWRLKTKDRTYFFQLLYQLFGDDPAFDGQQLSALVGGMRLKGPFRPLSYEGPVPKLMVTEQRLAGGELSAAQMKKVMKADTVVLVEKGLSSQPSSLLENMIAAGRVEALSLVLTGMDELNGSRLRTYEDKCEELFRFLHERIQAVGQTWGEQAERALTRVCRHNGLYMIGRSSDLSAVQALHNLAQVLEASTIPKEGSRVHPIYLSITIALAVHEGTSRFYESLQSKENIPAVFTVSLGEALYRFFVKNPAGWSMPDASYVEKDRMIERISASLQEALLAYAEEELCPALNQEDPVHWRKTLEDIIPPGKEALVRKPFLHETYAMVKACIERAGGIVIS